MSLNCSPGFGGFYQSQISPSQVSFSIYTAGTMYCCNEVAAGVVYVGGPSNYIIVNNQNLNEQNSYIAYVNCNYNYVECISQGLNQQPCPVSLTGIITFPENGVYQIEYFTGYIDENNGLVATSTTQFSYTVQSSSSTPSSSTPSSSTSLWQQLEQWAENHAGTITLIGVTAGIVGVGLAAYDKMRKRKR